MSRDQKNAFRVAGHGLLNAGARVFNRDGRRVRAADDASCYGKCACGLPSPEAWMTKRELYAWHRDHKVEVTGRQPWTTSTRAHRIGDSLEVPGPGTVTWTGSGMTFTPRSTQ